MKNSREWIVFFGECQVGSLNADVHPCLSHGVYVIVIPQGDNRPWARVLPQKDFRVDTTVAKSLSYVGGDLILWKQGCMFSMNYAIYVQWHHLYTMVIVLVQQNF